VRFAVTVLIIGFAVGIGATAARQGTGAPRAEAMSGGDLFQFYCATCHGGDAKGHGPAAEALRTEPPDLTTLSRRNGGRFPFDRVRQFITNDGLATRAHGSREMPVWGPIFLAQDLSDARTRIENVTLYIESLQVK